MIQKEGLEQKEGEKHTKEINLSWGEVSTTWTYQRELGNQITSKAKLKLKQFSD